VGYARAATFHGKSGDPPGIEEAGLGTARVDAVSRNCYGEDRADLRIFSGGRHDMSLFSEIAHEEKTKGTQ